jgi:hypothetical protein
MRRNPTSVSAHGVARSAGVGVALAALALVAMSALPARAEVDLTGTWQGTLDGGGQRQVRLRFSEDGFRLFDYTNYKGVTQTVEWSAPGRIQYELPGGGVKTVAVESVHKDRGVVSYVLHTAVERERNESLTRQFTYQQHEYRLTRKGMWVRIIRQTASSPGDRGGLIGGPVEVLEGIFTRMEVPSPSAASP